MKRILFLIPLLLLLSGCSGNWGWYVVDPTTTNGAANLLFMCESRSPCLRLVMCVLFTSFGLRAELKLVVLLPKGA